MLKALTRKIWNKRLNKCQQAPAKENNKERALIIVRQVREIVHWTLQMHSILLKYWSCFSKSSIPKLTATNSANDQYDAPLLCNIVGPKTRNVYLYLF